MEPLFFKAENVLIPEGMILPAAGFNGAAFFQSGKRVNRKYEGQLRGVGFNGAAFFQSGKRLPAAELLPVLLASMEPLFFKAENKAGDRLK